jgi:hypothetical protein
VLDGGDEVLKGGFKKGHGSHWERSLLDSD